MGRKTYDMSGQEVVGTSYKQKAGQDNAGYSGSTSKMNPEDDAYAEVRARDEETKPMVSMATVFRYATCGDIFLIFLGTLCAVIHGALYVVSNLVLGWQVDEFINFERGNLHLDEYEDIWRGMYGFNREEMWKNKTLIDVISQEQNLTGFNKTYLGDLNYEDFFEEMKVFTWWYFLMGGLTLLVAFGQITFWAIPAERQIRRIRTIFLKSVLRQEIGWYDRLGAGELNTRLSDDMTKIVDGIGDKFGTFIQMLACFIVAFAQGFGIGWRLSLVMLVIVPALTGAALVASALNSTLTNSELKSYAKAGKIAEEVLGAMRTVSAFGGEKKESARYCDNLYEARNKGIRKGLILGIGMGVAWFVLYGAYALGFWYGSKLIREMPWEYTPGKLLIVFFSILTGAVAIGQAGPKIQAVSTARGAAYTIFNIIDREPEIDSASEEGLRPPNFVGNIKFENVFFRYPTRPDVPVLNGLNLSISVGQQVALVGSSGCGKSTTVALIQRFYDVLGGRVTIDGIDIRDYNLKYLREHIGIVSQEPVLFGTTIAENIRYGRDGVTMDQIIEASKQANAYNFIMKLPQTFDTLVGDRGAQLSGGQKQRIAISRALVRNPKILLLDEATSALDTESEASVQNALEKAATGRTSIIIAHRLSTVRNADKICGFVGGVVVEEGRHEELIARDTGVYKTLVTLQTRQAAMDAQAAEVDDEPKKEPMNPDDIITQAPVAMDEEEQMARDLQKKGSFRRRASDVLRSSIRSLSRIGSGMGFGAVAAAQRIKESQEDEIRELDKFTIDPDVVLEPASVGRIASMNGPETPYIIVGCLASFINGAENPVFAVVFTFLLSVFLVDDLAEQERLANLYCLVFLAIGAAMTVSQFFMNYMFAQSGERLTLRLRDRAFKAMLRQDISWFDDHSNNLGALTTRLATDASNVQGATGSRLGLILQNVSNIGVGIIMAFVFGWKLTLVLFAFIPLIAIAGLVETKLLMTSAAGDKKELEKAGKVALEAIENIRTVAGLCKEQTFYEMYNEKLHIPYKNAIKKAFIFGFSFAISQTILYIAFAVAFLYGAVLIRNEEMDFNRVFMVVAVVIFGAMGIGETIAFAPDYTKARVAAARLFHLLDRVPPIDIWSSKGRTIANYSGTVELKGVRFRYPTRPTVAILRGVDLDVEPGKTLALVGSSGCGKSTTVSLVERFYEALRGEVLLDGVPIKELNLEWVRRQVGIVSQEPILFDATIAENIAYGDNFREVSMDEIIAAAKNSNIHNFIATLPLGYNTRVGDKGTQLSGGQKQRVAIARALVRNPKVLLLDEATSALDTESEKIVQEALDQARAGRTCIVIAHRLSTIQDSDCICVFHNGKIVERAKHKELLDLKGIYWTLQQVQSGAKQKIDD